jgi:hypothetical protein
MGEILCVGADASQDSEDRLDEERRANQLTVEKMCERV